MVAWVNLSLNVLFPENTHRTKNPGRAGFGLRAQGLLCLQGPAGMLVTTHEKEQRSGTHWGEEMGKAGGVKRNPHKPPTV